MTSDRCMLNVKVDADAHLQNKMLNAWYHWGIPVYLQKQWLSSIFGNDLVSFSWLIQWMKILRQRK